jgi:hypothetical protein
MAGSSAARCSQQARSLYASDMRRQHRWITLLLALALLTTDIAASYVGRTVAIVVWAISVAIALVMVIRYRYWFWA